MQELRRNFENTNSQDKKDRYKPLDVRFIVIKFTGCYKRRIID
jgi:hypothetical protein